MYPASLIHGIRISRPLIRDLVIYGIKLCILEVDLVPEEGKETMLRRSLDRVLKARKGRVCFFDWPVFMIS
jgi:hypothetical protein